MVYDAFGYATTKQILTNAGITAKPYGSSLNLEEILAAKPDLLVGVSLPTTVEQKSRLEQFSDVTILDYTADWQTALRATAQALGRQARAERIKTQINSAATTLKSDLAAAGLGGRRISVIGGSAETPFSPPADTNLGRLLTSLGLDRPAAQKAGVTADAPFVKVSPENLDVHDGDAMFLLTGQSYPLKTLRDNPLYPRLEAVRGAKVHEVSGEMWLGANPLSVTWVLDDIRTTLLDNKRPKPRTPLPSNFETSLTPPADSHPAAAYQG